MGKEYKNMCLICDRIDMIKNNSNRYFVKELNNLQFSINKESSKNIDYYLKICYI